jgi:hypothetical protein
MRGEQMSRNHRNRARVAVGVVVLLVLAGCAQSTPAWGPDSPRNGAGQFVHPVYGTPLPGQTMGYDM